MDYPLRDRADDLMWRLFWSRYTSWRQHRAYLKWLDAYAKEQAAAGTIPNRQGET